MRRRYLGIVAMVVLMSGEVHAQSGASRAVLWGGVGFDAGVTEALMRTGRYRELNPVLGQSAYRRVPLMIGSTVGVDLLTRVLGKKLGQGKLASGLNFSIGAVHIVVGGVNLR